jgi:phage terminase large subunit
MSIIDANDDPMTKTIELDYCSRWQFEGYHDRKQRWAVLVCHRRAGKTVATVCDLIIRACEENKPDGRYAMVAPLYNQVKDNAWNYLKHYARPLLAEEPREAELSVLLVNGAKIRLYGADNPDRLRGGYFDGVVLDEFADMKYDVWRCRGAADAI